MMKRSALRFSCLLLALTTMYFGINSCAHQEKSGIAVQPEIKNIIFMIGDGMSYPQIYATMLASNKSLVFSEFPYVGIVNTKSANKEITDSAAGGTALACGAKTKNGMIGMDVDSVALKSVLDIMSEKGKSTGFVVTSYVDHATPASFFGKNIYRSNYESIAEQLMNSDKINVAIGGGRKHFIHRKDGRDLLKEMEEKGWTVYDTLANIDISKNKYAVIASEGHMPPMPQRGDFLPKGVEIALQTLSKGENGFFVMVEGSQIDMACHSNDSANMINEMLDFNDAVEVALHFAKQNPNTLLVVTADHETGGLTLIDRQGKYSDVSFDYSTGSHSCLPVPIFAYGPGAENFAGWMDNTDVMKKILKLTYPTTK
jgi:Alkaline phosphatase